VMDSDCAICPLLVKCCSLRFRVHGSGGLRATRMCHGRHWTDDSMHVDGEDKNADESSEESEEDEEDLEGVKTIEVGCFVRMCVFQDAI
jgi:hypothetical protein